MAHLYGKLIYMRRSRVGDRGSGPQGGTVIFSYIRKLRPFWGFKIFNILGGFQKNEYFWGMKFLWIFFGSSQNWTIIRGHFYAF